MASMRYTIHPSPLGDLLIASTRKGLARIAFYDELRAVASGAGMEEPTLGEILRAAPFETVADERINLEVCRQLDEYFYGHRRAFELSVDLGSAGPSRFRRRVLKRLMEVPYGEVVTYAQLARLSGRPGAARAVGQVMHWNPVPVVVPCHRVVAANGSLGGYAGGGWRKELLLRREQAPRALPALRAA